MKKVFIFLCICLFSIPAYASDFPAKEIYARFSPSVMVIRATKEGGIGSIGTGSIITDDGLVITNAHVVINKEENKPYPKVSVFIKPKKLLGVTKDDLDKSYDVRILKFDVPLDLALLKIKGYDFKADVIELADPQEIEVGEEVIAIGHPEQGGFWTLTYGRISDEIKDFQGVQGKEMYQTDTSVNRGNSGGPLLDRRGYMVAVNSNIARLSKDGLPITGINFAIKSSVVKKWLRENGYNIAYGTKPLVEEEKTQPAAKPQSPEEKKTTPVISNKKPELQSEPVKAEDAGKKTSQTEKMRFATPKRPYEYDAFLKAAEKDLENMMEEMRGKFR